MSLLTYNSANALMLFSLRHASTHNGFSRHTGVFHRQTQAVFVSTVIQLIISVNTLGLCLEMM